MHAHDTPYVGFVSFRRRLHFPASNTVFEIFGNFHMAHVGVIDFYPAIDKARVAAVPLVEREADNEAGIIFHT